MAFNSRTIAAIAGVTLVAIAGVIAAQNPGITRTVVTRADVSVPDREAIVARIDVAPGGIVGWHTHAGDEISYVTEGEVTLMIAGQAPRRIATGEAFVVPAGVVHNGRNEGAAAARLVGVFVVEKGKPLASPVPEPAKQP